MIIRLDAEQARLAQPVGAQSTAAPESLTARITRLAQERHVRHAFASRLRTRLPALVPGASDAQLDQLVSRLLDDDAP